MAVTPMPQQKAARPVARLTCTWVPVRGQDGRTRMEMRWVDAPRRTAQPAA